MEEYGIFLLSQPSQKQLHQGWCTNHSIVIKKKEKKHRLGYENQNTYMHDLIQVKETISAIQY